jgi:hypothetical protein
MGSGDTGARPGPRAGGGLAAERRVDPDPLEFSTLNWISAGFRFVSR